MPDKRQEAWIDTPCRQTSVNQHIASPKLIIAVRTPRLGNTNGVLRRTHAIPTRPTPMEP
jgi:hypothetical protein